MTKIGPWDSIEGEYAFEITSYRTTLPLCLLILTELSMLCILYLNHQRRHTFPIAPRGYVPVLLTALLSKFGTNLFFLSGALFPYATPCLVELTLFSFTLPGLASVTMTRVAQLVFKYEIADCLSAARKTAQSHRALQLQHMKSEKMSMAHGKTATATATTHAAEDKQVPLALETHSRKPPPLSVRVPSPRATMYLTTTTEQHIAEKSEESMHTIPHPNMTIHIEHEQQQGQQQLEAQQAQQTQQGLVPPYQPSHETSTLSATTTSAASQQPPQSPTPIVSSINIKPHSQQMQHDEKTSQKEGYLSDRQQRRVLASYRSSDHTSQLSTAIENAPTDNFYFRHKYIFEVSFLIKFTLLWYAPALGLYIMYFFWDPDVYFFNTSQHWFLSEQMTGLRHYYTCPSLGLKMTTMKAFTSSVVLPFGVWAFLKLRKRDKDTLGIQSEIILAVILLGSGSISYAIIQWFDQSFHGLLGGVFYYIYFHVTITHPLYMSYMTEKSVNNSSDTQSRKLLGPTGSHGRTASGFNQQDGPVAAAAVAAAAAIAARKRVASKVASMEDPVSLPAISKSNSMYSEDHSASQLYQLLFTQYSKLDDALKEPLIFEAFHQFLQGEFSAENLVFWADVNMYQQASLELEQDIPHWRRFYFPELTNIVVEPVAALVPSTNPNDNNSYYHVDETTTASSATVPTGANVELTPLIKGTAPLESCHPHDLITPSKKGQDRSSSDAPRDTNVLATTPAPPSEHALLLPGIVHQPSDVELKTSNNDSDFKTNMKLNLPTSSPSTSVPSSARTEITSPAAATLSLASPSGHDAQASGVTGLMPRRLSFLNGQKNSPQKGLIASTPTPEPVTNLSIMTSLNENATSSALSPTVQATTSSSTPWQGSSFNSVEAAIEAVQQVQSLAFRIYHDYCKVNAPYEVNMPASIHTALKNMMAQLQQYHPRFLTKIQPTTTNKRGKAHALGLTHNRRTGGRRSQDGGGLLGLSRGGVTDTGDGVSGLVVRGGQVGPEASHTSVPSLTHSESHSNLLTVNRTPALRGTQGQLPHGLINEENSRIEPDVERDDDEAPFRPPCRLSTIFDEAQACIFQLMSRDSFRRFVATSAFRDCICEIEAEVLRNQQQQILALNPSPAQLPVSALAP